MQSITWIFHSDHSFSLSTVCGVLSNGKVSTIHHTIMDVFSWYSWLDTQYVCSTILSFLLLHDYGCKSLSTGNRVHFVYGKNTFHGS